MYRAGHQFLYLQSAEIGEQQEESQGKCRIAHPRYNERLAGGIAVSFVFVPEPDEQITANAHSFPSKVKQQQVVSQNKGQHRADKKIHIGEKAAVAVFISHKFY